MNRVLLPFQLQRGLAEQMVAPLGTDTAMVAGLADASAKRVGRSSDRTEAPALP